MQKALRIVREQPRGVSNMSEIQLIDGVLLGVVLTVSGILFGGALVLGYILKGFFSALDKSSK